MKEIVEKLISKNLTISTMESCTGGCLANEITNIEGSSNVLKFSVVTYSNEYKIKMNVDPNIIEKYTVYSIETAIEMSKKISDFSNSDIGIGITGKLNKADENNLSGNNNKIFISIYEKTKKINHNIELIAIKKNRKENKKYIVKYIINYLKEII